jgi:carbamoyltransferase
MVILGISCYYHDSAAAILKDGKILAAAQEERFTRIKHDASFPRNAVAFCLDQAHIRSEELDMVVFYDKPFLKFERILETALMEAPFGLSAALKSIPIWIKQKLWISDQIRTELKFEGKLLFPEHHQSHAASAFYPSPFDQAAILTMDGVGEWATTSISHGIGNEIKVLKELKFPHSLGLLYSAFTYHAGFKVNSGEYKLMGLAPYGKPIYVDLIYKHLIDLKEDGSFRLSMKYFDYQAGLKMTSPHFDALFDGPARKPEAPLTQREMDLAASIQLVTEDIMLKMAAEAVSLTGSRNLCLAGGVALNCVGNGRILKEKIVDNLWIQPASGDAGAALGAALLAWYSYQGNDRLPNPNDDMQGAFLGTSYSNEQIQEWLDANNIIYHKMEYPELYSFMASLLDQGNILGWLHGRMEFGPRALGHRSILADARNPEMQKKLNLSIKYRESFRPFAPIILREKASEYFDLDVESPYMLITAPVKESRRIQIEQGLSGLELLYAQRSDIPAVTHVDYSARVQTVDENRNPHLWHLLKTFENLTGAPLLVNTSFNVRGEPPVESPEDAFKCFISTEMDALVLENYVLLKSEQLEEHRMHISATRTFAPD